MIRIPLSRLAFMAAWVSAATCWWQPAHTHGTEPLIPLVRIGEIIIPDLRLELSADHTDVCLSWPAHVYLGSLKTGGWRGSRPWFTVFAEPQWAVRGKALRGVGGIRSHVPLFKTKAMEYFSLVADTGAVAGLDGSDAVAGLGVGFTDNSYPPENGSMFVLMYRYVGFFNEPRHDLSLDLLAMPF